MMQGLTAMARFGAMGRLAACRRAPSRRRGAAAIAVSVVAGFGLGPAQAQRVVPERSEVTFTAKVMGVPLEGRFRRFEAQVAFDPRQPEAGRIAIAIDMRSATFAAPEADAEVPKAPWFHAAQYPQATFASTSIRPAGPGRYDVAGRFTLKGQARDLVVPVTLSPGTPYAVATGGFTLRRLDHAVGDGEWADPSVVGLDVQVRFRLALDGLAP